MTPTRVPLHNKFFVSNMTVSANRRSNGPQGNQEDMPFELLSYRRFFLGVRHPDFFCFFKKMRRQGFTTSIPSLTRHQCVDRDSDHEERGVEDTVERVLSVERKKDL